MLLLKTVDVMLFDSAFDLADYGMGREVVIRFGNLTELVPYFLGDVQPYVDGLCVYF
jgi:hypothetical protein